MSRSSTSFDKTIAIGKNSVRVWVLDSEFTPISQESKRRLLITITGNDSHVMSSTILNIDNEQTASQLADAINAALGHAWPKEF